MTIVIIIFGCLLVFVGQAIIIADAFSKSILLGIGSFFTPIAIVYAIINWGDTKNPLIALLIGIIMLKIGGFF